MEEVIRTSDICDDRESPREHHAKTRKAPMTGRAPASTPTSNDRESPDDRESPREHNVVCAKGGKCKGRIHIKEAAHPPSKWHVTPRTARVKASSTPNARLIVAQTTM